MINDHVAYSTDGAGKTDPLGGKKNKTESLPQTIYNNELLAD